MGNGKSIYHCQGSAVTLCLEWAGDSMGACSREYDGPMLHCTVLIIVSSHMFGLLLLKLSTFFLMS